jgi:glutamate synthase (NADPH) large chain
LKTATSSRQKGVPARRFPHHLYMLTWMGRNIGLYSPDFEHDACGIGLVCTLNRVADNSIVLQGLTILERMHHRGGSGCDERSGDGAGILVQLPHAFLSREFPVAGGLPDPGDYALGMLFLPTETAQRQACIQWFEDAAAEHHLPVLGWRRVPVNSDVLGTVSRSSEPAIWQVLVGRGSCSPSDFPRRLFSVRRAIEKKIEASILPAREQFFVVSLSDSTVVYKGMLTVDQLRQYFPDLRDALFCSRIAIVHSRFSTNTFPSWSLAQPFRYLAHNGEINTLRGNRNWMRARERRLLDDPSFTGLAGAFPLLSDRDSDSASLDKAVELLSTTGRSLPHALMMLVPEAWENHQHLSASRRAFYEYHACLTEAWDGPAAIAFADGRYAGGILDRNGLRPGRYSITADGLVILASEAGVLPLDDSDVIEQGRLEPGRMFLVDLHEGRIVPDDEIKERVAARKPYGSWLRGNLLTLEDLQPAAPASVPVDEELNVLQRLFGYTEEDVRLLIAPMATGSQEATGSMGDDTPIAILSEKPRLVFDYFRQLFAQVTNPPLDAIREELVTSLFSNIGAERPLATETAEHCRMLRLEHPILTDIQLATIRACIDPDFVTSEIAITYDPDSGENALDVALHGILEQAGQAVSNGSSVLVLSDRDCGPGKAPIPSLLATAAVHHHLIGAGTRSRCSIIVESAEPREVHHFATLIGYGAAAVNPYLALATAASTSLSAEPEERARAQAHYQKAICKGLLKVMSKMGISTLQSYRGAQIFEAVGISRSVIDRHFAGTPSRIGGLTMGDIGREARLRYEAAYPDRSPAFGAALETGGRYQWRRDGEHHLFNPLSVARLQQAVRQDDWASYTDFATSVNDQSRTAGTLRGMLEFAEGSPIPIDEVEAWTDIVKRFKTGAMSYGSISLETHETLAVAMNRIGGRSNTGEGGEDPDRFDRASERRSRIKQVASGRFGVTIGYLASADEIQIKMAQGAKPGEGGQLPGEKVYPWIARTRHSTPWVGLISPPPHHDIYSIEDLAQLIHDLKNANPAARISVKLVSEVGVGTIAAGVAKAKAEVVLISGHDGGTGASPQTSIMHAGLPWELGLAETHQTLLLNGLRERIRVECDGQLKTGRDVAIAALLGADEFGFATAPLVAMGCIMMRKCHLNTCPVGIATQDPDLRAKFAGKPEHVINYLHFVAEELRAVMAQLGFRTVDEMVGRTDCLRQRSEAPHWKAATLDLSPLLARPERPAYLGEFTRDDQDHGLDRALDMQLLPAIEEALHNGERIEIQRPIENINRTVGTILSGWLASRHGAEDLPEDTVRLLFHGTAGQSFMAFGAPGITAIVRGQVNDYLGKGLSGARVIVRPPKTAPPDADRQVLVGNVALYGATSGEVFVRGRAGERFAVRNSGVRAVVEGVGDHGCEYMTGGRVVVLGTTGRNFAAGMSGGIAYVWDERGAFTSRCNTSMVNLLPLEENEYERELLDLLSAHHRHTKSTIAAQLLADWPAASRCFVVVMPTEYQQALRQIAAGSPGNAAAGHRAA